MRVILGLIFAMAALEAAAQTATTQCNDAFGTGDLRCTSQAQDWTPAPRPAPSTAYQDASNRVGAEAAAGRQSWVRQRVGRKIAAGDCDGARQTALKAGDLDLAERVNQLCAP